MRRNCLGRPGLLAVVAAVVAVSVSWAAFAEGQPAGPAFNQANLGKIKLPPGFKISVFAQVPRARSMAVGEPMGVVFVGTRYDKVYAVVDRNKDGIGDEVIAIASDLKVPNGIAFKGGVLYVAEQHRIIRFFAPEFDIERQFPPEVIFENLPDKFAHGWRYAAVGPDDRLYVAVGIPCNICDPQGIEGTIIRMDLDGKNMEVYASGVRNSVGMDWHPVTGEMFFTNNGADGLGDDVPPDTLLQAPRAGLYFGFPYVPTAGGETPTPGYEGKSPPQPVARAALNFQAHVAPLGIHFYRGSMFPEEYRNSAFVALHGSWNRSVPVGYEVLRIKFDQEGQPVSQEVFATGWLQGRSAWGRPVDIKELPDGSLLVSDDFAGVIYRITYEGR
ncbi:MAG: PQQ-dependent sugar dehydrogenase [Bacillota bacterium]